MIGLESKLIANWYIEAAISNCKIPIVTIVDSLSRDKITVVVADFNLINCIMNII